MGWITRLLCSVLTAAIVAAFPAVLPAQASAMAGESPGHPEYHPGRVLVKVVPNFTPLSLATDQSAPDLAVPGVVRVTPLLPASGRTLQVQAAGDGSDGLSRWYRVELTEGAGVEAVLAELKKLSSVERAEPDYLRRPAASSPADVSAAFNPWHLSAASIPQARQFLSDRGIDPGGRRDVVVAVIDSGVDYTHPDLVGNMWINTGEIPGNGADDDQNGYTDDIHGANFVGNSWSESGDPMDDHGHGTHVAGIIAARGTAGNGVVGVAPNVQIMALKAAQYSGALATSDIAQAIYYAVEKGADVINMSFGGYFRAQVEEDALAVAFGQAVLVAAAGNDARPNIPCPGGADMYPAAYPWVLGVMARGSNGRPAAFSNKDCIARDAHEYELEAPGVAIPSTLPGNQYAAWSGTSMAAPVVAGAAALVRSYYQDKNAYSSRFIMGQIAATANGGQVDVYAALTEAASPDLKYLEHWVFDPKRDGTPNDADGRVDAGETVDLGLVIRNHWGKADDVTVTLRSRAPTAVLDDPYVSWITDSVQFGAVGNFSQDDNGLIRDSQGAITGAAQPFRLTVASNAPNDHLIPIQVTITARNGLNPSDTTTMTFQSHFYLAVQRGRELPRIISQDMTLSRDDYWIIPDQTLIEAGVTVRVTPGTQLQFGSSTASPYSLPPNPGLVVQGSLVVEGTPEDPVDMFTGLLHMGGHVFIEGNATLRYARIDTPYLKVVSLDHVLLTVNQTPVEDVLVSASVAISNSIFRKIVGKNRAFAYPFRVSAPRFESNLFERGAIGSHANGMEWNMYLLPNTYSLSNHMPAETVGNVFLNQDAKDWAGNNLPSALGFPALSADQQTVINNAFLLPWTQPSPDIFSWLWVTTADKASTTHIAGNYWGTASDLLIGAAIYDYNDDFSYGRVVYQPVLTEPPASAYPFVSSVTLTTQTSAQASVVGAETVTFTVRFNRDMDTSVQPRVTFGPDEPYTDYTVVPVGAGWQDARTWTGTFYMTPLTGDGYHSVRVAGARAATDSWLVTGDDSGRFRFEVITSGTSAMNLQAAGAEGAVELAWAQDDFDLLAGYNIYRAPAPDGPYAKLNTAVIPNGQRSFRDKDVVPGQTYHYKFTVIRTDMSESAPSNVAAAAPLDTVAPVISHSPVTVAAVGMPVTLTADVTDNVAVQSVTVHYRPAGAPAFQSRAMAHSTASRYSATLEGHLLTAPGLEYYLEASDGINYVRSGRIDAPYQIAVSDKPTVTSVSPNSGPISGGTTVTISGANFKAGATVTFGGTAATAVTVENTNRVTASTPAHVPGIVDVVVRNEDGGTHTALKAFTYFSDVVPVVIPDMTATQGALVEIPITAANVRGLRAVDLTLSFDPLVLKLDSVQKGNLTTGFSSAENFPAPGLAVVSLASGTAVDGTGNLLLLRFTVLGQDGQSTQIALDSLLMNNGSIPHTLTPGLFQVANALSLTGAVSYFSSAGPVAGVTLNLVGAQGQHSGLTDAGGTYSLTGISPGSYTLTPSKSGEVRGITAYDAALILQAAVGSRSLTSAERVAADLDRDGSIGAMDAAYVLEHAVGLLAPPFPGAGQVWAFSPTGRSYPSMNASQTGQDFAGVLIGDVSGSWGTATAQGVMGAGPAQEPVLTLGVARVSPGGRVSVAVQLSGDHTPLYSAQLGIGYDPAVLRPVSAVKGESAGDFAFAANLGETGVVRVAMAGAAPIAGAGTLVVLTFDAIGAAGTASNLQATEALIDEQTASAVAGGRIAVILAEDLDANNAVDASDLLAVLKYWQAGSDGPGWDLARAADMNGDGRVSLADLARVARRYGWTPQ